MPAYQPVACGFYDRLEVFALRRTPVEVVYRDAEGETQAVQTHLADVFARGKEEYALLGTGEAVRLDRLVSVGGVEVPKAC